MIKTIEAVDIDHAWTQALRLVLDHGVARKPRGLSTLACSSPVGISIKNPRMRILSNPERGANQAFMAGEFTWIFTGSNQLKQIEFYNRRMTNFSDDGLTLWGAYGPRFKEQLAYVINCLGDDPETRQAVMTFWRSSPQKTKDVPCTVALMFKRTGRSLDLTVLMRSNDLWLGFPYDIFTFTLIQEVIAAEIGAEVGTYHHLVNDLHLYEPHFLQAHRAASINCDSPMMPKYLEGNFAVLSHSLGVYDNLLRNGTTAELPTEPLAKWLCQKMKTRLDQGVTK